MKALQLPQEKRMVNFCNGVQHDKHRGAGNGYVVQADFNSTMYLSACTCGAASIVKKRHSIVQCIANTTA